MLSKPLRRELSIKIGRANEYKAQDDCLHIGDLKVPKKYIVIHTGSQPLESTEQTPLSITFESICTTTVNGEVYKLPSKEAEPITKNFPETDLLLKVNANKSDRIQLRLQWYDLNSVVFSKKMSYDNEVMVSPLPTVVRSLYESGTDIRMVADPLNASHYLTLVDMNDYNMRIALLRAIPIVSYAWTDAIKDEPEKVDDWLVSMKDEYLYPKSENNFVYPDTRRRTLLGGINSFVCYGTFNKQVKRLQEWIKCLGSEPQMVEVKTPESVEALLAEASSPYVFFVEDDEKVQFLRDRSNSPESLWKALVSCSRASLQQFPVVVKRESQPGDLRLTQRKKRRKLEKVGDTDFFLFSQVLSTPVPEPEDAHEIVPELVPPSIQVEATDAPGSISRKELPEATEPPLPIEMQTPENKATELTTQSIEPSVESNKRPPDTIIEPEPKKLKPEPPLQQKKIIPRVSLADAVLSTKKQADDVVKRELGLDGFPDDVNQKLDNLVIVEEVDLLVRRSKEKTEVTPDYRGRKNFKKFHKVGQVPKNVTRSFIQLEEHDNSIHFEDLEPLKKSEENTRLKGDFEKELSSVKGYQPEASQLFVQEDSDSDTDTPFSFLTKSNKSKETTTATMVSDDDDDNDDVTFAFSRN